MADREIRLIGSFQDDITPRLNRLNRQLLGTLRQFERLQNRIAPVAAEMAKFNSAASMTAGSLKTQRSAIEENIRMLRQYRTELSRTATAQSRMGSMRPPRGGGGGGGGRGGRGGGYDGGGAGAAFGVTLGNQLASAVTGAVVLGFQTGAQIMMAPFRYGADAIAERIRDEMSDVRAAGGLFSISQRMQKPIFGSFAQAENYTKDQNRYLAKLAGSLPGDTQEYIQVAKQISDGIFTIVAQDGDNARKLATQLATERGATAQEISKLSQGGATAMQQTGKELVGEMTKLTVLAGLGGRQGAYGLPQLTERMLSEQQVSMGMFQRYAAIFRDPMIKGALERNIKNINATGKDTTARLEALRNTFKEIVTPDLVRRYQRTTAGVLEALKTSFLNPEVGLLGLGRPLAQSVVKFDDFGNRLVVLSKAVTINGQKFEKGAEVTAVSLQRAGYKLEEVGRVATDNLSIFDYLRDIFANVMIVLQPIIDNISNLFDPFERLGFSLSKFREATMGFQNAFERYRLGLEEYAKKNLKGNDKALYEGTIPFRAAIAAINDAMRAYGGYGKEGMKEFERVGRMLEDPKTTPKQMGEIIKGILDKFLSSDFAKKIGESLGIVIGTVVSQVGSMMKAAAGLATGGKLADGFAEGFRAAGGPQGVTDVIKSVFHLFGKLLLEVIKAAPLESAIVASLVAFGPALAAAVSTAMVNAIGKWAVGALGLSAPAAEGAGAATGLAAILATPAVIAAIVAAAVAVLAVVAKKTEKQRQQFTKPIREEANRLASISLDPTGKKDEEVLGNIWRNVQGEFMWVVHDFVEGFGNLFAGLYDFVVGLFTDPVMVKDGINKMLTFVGQFITGCGHLIIGLLKMVPGLLVGLAVAIKNLFMGLAMAIQEAWDKRPQWMGGRAEGAKSTLKGKPVVWKNGQWVPAYSGTGSGVPMGFSRALALESRNMPRGARPVIANSSELIIPTAAGGQGDINALIMPLQSIDAKTSTVAAYISQMRNQISGSIRQTTEAINTMSGKINAGMPVKVVNQPTVKFSGMGPIGGGIGKFPKTSGYGMRWGRMHSGNDYGMPIGTKLAIGGPGRILFAGSAGGYGNMVDIGGPDGMVYRFAHLSKFLAPVGATLPPGVPFALSGNSGRSTGPHLHFEARPGGGGPVPPDAFANIIRANFVGSPFGPLMGAMQKEMKGMPYGSQLAVANSDEIFMKPKQMANVIEGATRAGAEGVGNITTGPITISIDGYNQDPKQLTEIIASELITAMYRKSRSEVLTS